MQVLGYVLMKASALQQLQLEIDRKQSALNELADIADGRARTVALQQAHLTDARGRATHAEAMVQLQTKSIDQLMASNERMVKIVADMRRVGFGILTPAEMEEPVPASVYDADREAVEKDPELEADDFA